MLPFIDLAPNEWVAANRPLYVRGYLVPLITSSSCPTPPAPIDLPDLRFRFGFGELTFLTARPRLEIDDKGDARFRGTSNGGLVTTKPSGFVLLLSPLAADTDAEEQRKREELDEWEGILLSLAARGAAYEHLFDNVLNLRTGAITAYLGQVHNPGWYPRPDIPALQELLPPLGSRFAALAQADRNRVGLALKWLAAAAKDIGTDAFIKCWVAIETLAMSGTDIRPLEQKLAQIYSCTLEETRDRFQIGRVFGLRSEIVHNGRLVPIPGEVTRYLEGVFTDLLLDLLSLPPLYRSSNLLTQGSFSLSAWLHATLA